jgi:hypothetical protein
MIKILELKLESLKNNGNNINVNEIKKRKRNTRFL